MVNVGNKFKLRLFKDCDLRDPFFLSLKEDYPKFEDWFKKKSVEGAKAYVASKDSSIGAFLYLKDNECEPLVLATGEVPAEPRLKIGTFKLSKDEEGKRLGEGAVGIALGTWLNSSCDKIYVTVFPKHTDLITILTRFGFKLIGNNKNGEGVYVKSKSNIDRTDAYTMYPYFDKTKASMAKIIPIEEGYHDALFPNSELQGTEQFNPEIAAGNGVTKIFIATPFSTLTYNPGQPIFVYRKAAQHGGYKSVISSYCSLEAVDYVKRNGRLNMALEQFLAHVGNKSVYSVKKLTDIFRGRYSNIIILKLLYMGYFGKGNNVNWRTLKDSGLWPEAHPYTFSYSFAEFSAIMRLGKKDPDSLLK